MTAEQKIDAWYNGTRGMNISACLDDKILDYYILCIQKGYIFQAVDCLYGLRRRNINIKGFHLVNNCEPLSYQKIERFFASFNYFEYDKSKSSIKRNASQKIISYSPHVGLLEYNGNSVKVGEQFIDTATGSIDYTENPVEAFNTIIDTLFA